MGSVQMLGDSDNDGGFDPWVGQIPWRRAWQVTPVFLPGESHGQRNLAGCSPRGRKESEFTFYYYTGIKRQSWDPNSDLPDSRNQVIGFGPY